MKASKSGRVLSRLTAALAPAAAPKLAWRPGSQTYPRLSAVPPEAVEGRSGLYLLWHLGVRPQWLRAGFTLDLRAAVAILKKTEALLAFEPHDGPFLSWAYCDKGLGGGATQYLAAELQPARQDLNLSCDVPADPNIGPIFCALPPGTNFVQIALNRHADRK